MENVHYHDSFPSRIALEFLRRDYRPTLMLRISGERFGEPVRYRELFVNDAFRRYPELNEEGMYQLYANMAGSNTCIRSWIVHTTLIDDPDGSIAVVTASSFESRSLGNGRAPRSITGPGAVLGPAKYAFPGDDVREPCRPSIREIGASADGYFPLQGEDIVNARTRIQTENRTFPGASSGRVDIASHKTFQASGQFDALIQHHNATPPSSLDTLYEGLSICHTTGETTPCRRSINQQPEKPEEKEWIHRPVADWRTPPASPQQHDPPYFKQLRSVDWSQTAFGPLEKWPLTLRSLSLAIMGSPIASALYWGPDYNMMFNEAYKRARPNGRLGASYKATWPEQWELYGPLLNATYYGGKATRRESQPFALSREDLGPGFLEESYYDFLLLPIIQESGVSEGIFAMGIDQTKTVVAIRRLETLGKLSNSLRTIQNFDNEFWKRLGAAFDDNPLDSPMLILYCTGSSSDDSIQHLKQAIGVAPGGMLAPYVCFAGCAKNRPAGLFHEEMHIAREQNKVVIKNFPPSIRASGEMKSRGFNEPPVAAAIIPIQVSAGSTSGFMILGLNQRRPFDDGYRTWLDSIAKELAASATGVWMRQQEFLRAVERERQGPIKQLTIELKDQLTQQSEALRRSELLFTQMAETLPVGLLLIDLEGTFYYSNHTARNMFCLTSDQLINDGWESNIYHEDRERVVEAFGRAVKEKTNLHTHHRVGNGWGERGWRYWVAASMIVQVDELTGGVSRFMASLVDITSHKKNEEFQRQLSQQAVERRRKQENFIDIFSHELRNPFSATLQCADSILNSLTDFQGVGTPIKVEELVDSAQIILVCVQHQMRIIDDVLTLSKLESLALTIVPINVRLHESVVQMMKIFRSELQVKHIQSRFIIEDSYHQHKVDWVMADPSRFSQVLVNLLTNAIKFSRPVGAEKREITVRLAASEGCPASHGDVVYQNHDSPDEYTQAGSQFSGKDWGTGRSLYIQTMVEDTGIGISNKWQAKLFRRFEQVPETHITYGGSGLGLYICRRLCRIQGGEIGFWSEEGRGSRFAFYIKVCRSDGPPADSPDGSELMNLNKFCTDSVASTPAVASINEISDAVPDPTAAPARRSTAYRVLIVEDNLINQEVLRRQLKNEGCITHVANNGQQALDFVKTSTFAAGVESLDIILMDKVMPVMDGCTAARKIRELEASGELVKHVPIMGISANARPEQVKLMMEAGMDDAIPKPFRISTLLERFEKLMKRLSVAVPPLPPPPLTSQPQPQPRRLKPRRTASILQHSPPGQGMPQPNSPQDSEPEDMDARVERPKVPTPGQLQFRLTQLYDKSPSPENLESTPSGDTQSHD